MDGEKLLSVRDLRVYYHLPQGVVKAVDGVSFEVRRGEVLGIAGESGSGKSTLISAIMGLVSPPGRIEGGQIIFEGRDLTKLSPEEYRRIRGKDIAMVFQDPVTYLDPLFTNGFQIAEVYEAHEGVKPKKALDRAVQVLKMVRMADPERRAHSYPHQLSGGMRQRVLISMGIAARPKLLIADEPTSALDVTIQAEIIELLMDLKRDLGMTVLFVSHDLNLLAEITDRIMVMYAGKIVEIGPTREVVNNPQHPYTEALLGSFGFERKKKYPAIRGYPPSLITPPPGCRFHPRCPKAFPECSKREPHLIEIKPGWRAACLLHES